MKDDAHVGRLPTKQECLGILALTADLEGPEVLVPVTLRSFRLRLPPKLELVEILGAYLPLPKPFEKVITKRWWKVFPPYLRD
jgi:hypothetical protein